MQAMYTTVFNTSPPSHIHTHTHTQIVHLTIPPTLEMLTMYVYRFFLEVKWILVPDDDFLWHALHHVKLVYAYCLVPVTVLCMLLFNFKNKKIKINTNSLLKVWKTNPHVSISFKNILTIVTRHTTIRVYLKLFDQFFYILF